MSNNILEMTREEWARCKANMRTSLEGSRIAHDINPAQARTIISRIDEQYSYLRLQLAELESGKERVDAIIREVEKKNLTGKNEAERKKNSVEAVTAFDTGSDSNLYEIQNDYESKYTYVKGALDVLLAKQHRLITINGLLKLEKGLGDSQSSFNGM